MPARLIWSRNRALAAGRPRAGCGQGAGQLGRRSRRGVGTEDLLVGVEDHPAEAAGVVEGQSATVGEGDRGSGPTARRTRRASRAGGRWRRRRRPPGHPSCRSGCPGSAVRRRRGPELAPATAPASEQRVPTAPRRGEATSHWARRSGRIGASTPLAVHGQGGIGQAAVELHLEQLGHRSTLPTALRPTERCRDPWTGGPARGPPLIAAWIWCPRASRKAPLGPSLRRGRDLRPLYRVLGLRGGLPVRRARLRRRGRPLQAVPRRGRRRGWPTAPTG